MNGFFMGVFIFKVKYIPKLKVIISLNSFSMWSASYFLFCQSPKCVCIYCILDIAHPNLPTPVYTIFFPNYMLCSFIPPSLIHQYSFIPSSISTPSFPNPYCKHTCIHSALNQPWTRLKCSDSQNGQTWNMPILCGLEPVEQDWVPDDPKWTSRAGLSPKWSYMNQ